MLRRKMITPKQARTSAMIVFHALDQASRAVVSDLQPSLNVGSRYFAVAGHDLNRFVEKIVRALAARIKAEFIFGSVVRLFGDGIKILWLSLSLQEPHNILN